MLYADGALGLLLLGLWLFAIFDVIATDSALCRNLPKLVWLLIVVALPDVGSVAWLVLGRPTNARFRPGDTGYRPPRHRPLGPEDAPQYMSRSEELNRRLEAWEEQQRRKAELQSRDLKAWETELQQREDDLRRREQGLGPGPAPSPGESGEGRPAGD